MVDLRTINDPKITLVLHGSDIAVNFSGVWPPGMLWIAAALLTRTANQIQDGQEQQMAMMQQTLAREQKQ